jgi:hypothetical protein
MGIQIILELKNCFAKIKGLVTFLVHDLESYIFGKYYPAFPKNS